jgi:hypothetical protein
LRLVESDWVDIVTGLEVGGSLTLSKKSISTHLLFFNSSYALRKISFSIGWSSPSLIGALNDIFLELMFIERRLTQESSKL